jgi:hypothetical protein
MKEGLPRKAFAYAPTPDPATWKLPYLSADGSIDTGRLPAAVAAVGEGFRGEKVDVPAEVLPAIKSRLRAAYRKWKGSDVEYPAGIAERVYDLGDGITLREAVIVQDKAAKMARILTVGEDTIVFPDYDGAWEDRKPPMPESYPMLDIEQAAHVLGKIAVLRKDTEEPEEQASLDAALNAMSDYLKAEATEPEECEDCGHEQDCTCTNCPCAKHGGMKESAFDRLISEVGKRNSGADATRIQSAHDLMHDLGATHAQGKVYGGSEVVAEAQIEMSGPESNIRFREASNDAHLVTLAEASPIYDEATRTVWITPIKPGWGNQRDNNYYPTGTLKEAVGKGVFNNLKMYKDHPRKTDEKELPERSVKDWFATTREAVWDDVKGVPRVPVVVHEDADFRRFKDVPEQIAFSVLGSGVGRPGAVDGKKGRVIESIARLRSVDWVTEAGAGGAIAFAESASNEEYDMDIENLTADELREGNPRLYEHLVGLGKALAGIDADEKSAERAAAKAAKDAEEKPPEAPAETKESDVEDAPAWASALIERIEKIEARESGAADTEATNARIAEAKVEASGVVSATLAESTIPGTAKEIIAAKFAEVTIGEGMDFESKDDLIALVTSETKAAAEMLAPFMAKSQVEGLGGTVEDESSVGVREAAVTTIAARFGPIPSPAKNKLVWSADELSGQNEVAEKAVEVEKPITESGDVATLSEAGQKALDAITARF